MEGVLTGGWEFVWLAYGVSAVVLIGYSISVYVRYRTELRRQAHEARRESKV
jgi:heme exporter protein CcmD